ncbi:hypothetical protein [Fonticella tunisiensis]|uniref:Uncharacterized protein n=1 Tax=Fonticella tunisiensis TaxID=1096341 RepID=A0A4R7KUN6_9CLOT|nr:hypothetical protein [Fonticella tunisiensis]TDT63444.1 hypothetical protein EDD71_102206 [Fonticella tunisiensis]
MAKILVSFKQKEMHLYELVKAQGDQSNFVKDALKFYLEHKNNSAPAVKTEATIKSDEILDILSGV